MGDRVLMQCHDSDDFGPVVYGHWSGADAVEIVKRLRARMATRKDDLNYWSARLVQEAINSDAGATGFGVWNAKAKLVSDDSHGDAGCVLIDVRTGAVQVSGGYLTDGDFK